MSVYNICSSSAMWLESSSCIIIQSQIHLELVGTTKTPSYGSHPFARTSFNLDVKPVILCIVYLYSVLLYARRPANPDNSRRRRINSQLIVYNMILLYIIYHRTRDVVSSRSHFSRATQWFHFTIIFFPFFFFYRRRLRSAGGEITLIILYT